MTFIFPNDQETEIHDTFGETSLMFFYNPAGYLGWVVVGQIEQ